MNRWKEIGLPLILAISVAAAAALDAPNYGPHETGIVYLLMVPLLIALAVMSITAMRKKRWLRLIALIAAMAVCAVCGEWLGREQLCPECDREYFTMETEDSDEGCSI